MSCRCIKIILFGHLKFKYPLGSGDIVAYGTHTYRSHTHTAIQLSNEYRVNSEYFALRTPHIHTQKKKRMLRENHNRTQVHVSGVPLRI